MKIIILEGKSNIGKTTTMGMVFVALHMNGAKMNNFNALESPSGMDFEADFAYTVNEKTLKIAMYTKGDNIKDCNDAIKRYSQNMNVLIIAYSTKVRPLKISPNDTVEHIAKTTSSSKISEVQSNANDGYEILCKI